MGEGWFSRARTSKLRGRVKPVHSVAILRPVQTIIRGSNLCEGRTINGEGDVSSPRADEAAAREPEPQVRLIKLNSDAEQAVASRLGIQGIPTMILFLKGREVARTSGAMSATQIVRWVRDRLLTVAV